MRLFERGTCAAEQDSLFYVVMEYADENLSQVIPDRPLTVEEAKQVLEPALSALAYLHSRGFAHGHLKPSNFMAIDSSLKISSDGVSQNRRRLTEAGRRRLVAWHDAGGGVNPAASRLEPSRCARPSFAGNNAG